MRHRPTLTADDARRMMAAAKAEAAKHDWKVAIAVVDEAGALLLLERLDGAHGLTAELAHGKAKAAAALRRPSAMAAELLKQAPGLALASIGLPLPGGVPVMCEGECVGAVAASGAAAHEDEQVASAGVAALG
ncbi:MAG: heme-binding protein [Caulobacteraceae bacterium]|nr:heme-binding protein [Caulobacteraceae bacterium]